MERNIEKCCSQNIILEVFYHLVLSENLFFSLSLEPDSLYMSPFLCRECLLNGPPTRDESSEEGCGTVTGLGCQEDLGAEGAAHGDGDECGWQ